ncbi:hypothetical protein J1614_002870, partial [Plenodomus biglobosus]
RGVVCTIAISNFRHVDDGSEKTLYSANAEKKSILRLPYRTSLDSPSQRERVFIASIHENNERSLRSRWRNALVDLARHLGPENIFVVVLESGSRGDSKGALRQLDCSLEQIGVNRWIKTPCGCKDRRRISYLSDLRNMVMLQMLKQSSSTSKHFDKVLWLNDTEDVLKLLATREGDYAAACSMDFVNPPNYYDTFALRDAAGRKTASQT